MPNRIRLDPHGDAIVSEGVWAELQEAFGMLAMPSVFLLMGEVKDPPTLVIGGTFGESKRVFQLHDGALHEREAVREALHVAGRT